MGDCNSTEAAAAAGKKPPVRLVCVKEGTLTVFGEEYVVKKPPLAKEAANAENGDESDAKTKENEKTTPQKAPQQVKPKRSNNTTLVMKLRPHLLDFSGDSFTVVDVSTDTELFEVGGDALSFNQRRYVVDAKTKKQIFYMDEEYFQLGDDQTIFKASKKNGGSTEVCRVCSGLGNYTQWTEGLHNSNGKPIKLGGKMGIFLKGHIFIDKGQEGDSRKAIARIMSPLDWCDFWPKGWERDSYLVEVSPGVDSALILAMVLAIEKMLQTYDNDSSFF